MSDRAVEGVRLLRAVFYAQREVDAWRANTGRYADARWFDADQALTKAKADLDAFMANDAELPVDFKVKQAGERP